MIRPRTPRAPLSPLIFVLAFGAGLAACNESDVGKVCSSKEDCAGDLICDVHDGKGTCQEDHHHNESATSTEGATTDATDGATTDATTTDATGGATTHATDDASTTHMH